MPDHKLLELASRVGSAAQPPEFRDIARRGERLRRLRTGGAGAAVAALLAVTVFGVQSVYDDQATPVPPAQPTYEPLPSPPLTDNSSTPLEDLTPEQIVYDESAALHDVTAVPSGGPDATASIWSVCRKSTCARALALTTDGFASASYVDVTDYRAPTLGDAGGGSVLVADGGFQGPTIVVRPDGSTKDLQRSTVPGPMHDGEVLLDGPQWVSYRQSFFKTISPVAIDSATATSHPISIPEEDTFVQLVQSGPSTLWGSSGSIDGGDGELTAIWSNDGGTTWESEPLSSTPGVGLVNLGGSVDGVMAFAQQSASDTPAQVYGSLDGGRTWQTTELPAQASTAVIDGVVGSDDSLLISAASSGEADGTEPRADLYKSSGTDWGTLGQVDAPFAVVTDADGAGFRLTSSAPYTFGGPTAIYAYQGSRMWVSTDDGVTWTEQATR